MTRQGSRVKVPIIGSSSINLAEFASAAEQKEFELNIPVVSPATPVAESRLFLSVSPSWILHLLLSQTLWSCPFTRLMLVLDPGVSQLSGTANCHRNL